MFIFVSKGFVNVDHENCKRGTTGRVEGLEMPEKGDQEMSGMEEFAVQMGRTMERFCLRASALPKATMCCMGTGDWGIYRVQAIDLDAPDCSFLRQNKSLL